LTSANKTDLNVALLEAARDDGADSLSNWRCRHRPRQQTQATRASMDRGRRQFAITVRIVTHSARLGWQ